MNNEIEKFSTSFLKIPNSFSEMTITSIQSFESSLFMIMLSPVLESLLVQIRY